MHKTVTKSTIAILSVALLAGLLLSCGVNEKDLIGEWEMVTHKVKGAAQAMEKDERNQGYYFGEDGTLVMMNMLTQASRGTWSLNGSTLTIDVEVSASRMIETGKHTIEINSLSQDELVLTTIIFDSSGKKEIGKITETYRKN